MGAHLCIPLMQLSLYLQAKQPMPMSRWPVVLIQKV